MALTVGDLRVEPGQRSVQLTDVPVGEETVAVPVIAVNGAREGPRVAITAGIHGAEYVGIEAARRLGMGLDPEAVTGSAIVVPVANPAAFHRRAIYTSGLNDQNLNRVFPGRAEGSATERLAHWLFTSIIGPSDFYVDMHGGDMIEALVPFVLYVTSENQAVDAQSRQMAVASGLPRIIRSSTQGSTYAAAAAAGIPAILAEVGGQGVWDEGLVEQHMESTRRVLQQVGVLPGAPPAQDQRFFDTFAWMRSEAAGLLHPEVRIGEHVEQGQVVAAVTDYFGRELQRLTAVTGGEVAFLVTSLAINRGDPILAIVS